MLRRLPASIALLAIVAVSLAAGLAVRTSDASAADAPAAASLPSAADLDAYLAGKGSPMAGQGSAFLASGGRWQVDPRLLVAIAGAESNFGSITCAPFNAWGWGCPNGPYEFTTWADGIDTVAEGLRTNYLAEGRVSVAQINLKYAPIGAANDPTGLNNHWTTNVSRFLIELGGDPTNVDISGVAGTRLLGAVEDAAAAAEYGFSEDVDAPDAGTGEERASDEEPTLEVSAGAPRPLVVTVRNTGDKAWTPSTVRLRRVDIESRVVGDPYGSLVDTESVAPGTVGRFVVLLGASGDTTGTAATRWRLEGPAGPFGIELERPVRFAVPALVIGDSRAEVTQRDDGTSAIVVRIRNAGSATWRRDGDDRVLLGVRARVGTPLEPVGWINRDVVGPMLERSVEPGETATFAFRVRGTDGALAVAPFDANRWATGAPVAVFAGQVPEADAAALRTRQGELAS